MSQNPSVTALQEDTWLSTVFGYPVFRLVTPASSGSADLSAALLGSQTEKRFVYCRVPTQDVATVHALEEIGFRVVETSLTLSRPVSSWTTSADGHDEIVVRMAKADDRVAVGQLAARNMVSSRFHADPLVPAELAARVKRLWAENFFHGKRGDAMVVACDGDEVVAFNLLLFADDGTLIIDLIAVDEAHRGQRIAERVSSFPALHCPSNGIIKVGTQVKNTAALRSYTRMGFSPVESSFMLHAHGALASS